MSESGGAAVLAIFLAFIGFALIVMGVRGTYPEVWATLTSAAPQADTVGNVQGTQGGTSGGKSTVK